MELTFPMAVRLSVYPPTPPFLIPTWEAIGDFFSALLKALRSSVLFGAFTGLNLLDKAASSSSFCRPARTFAMAKQPSFPSADLLFSFRRNTVCDFSYPFHSTLPISPIPCAWRGIFACPNFQLNRREGGRPHCFLQQVLPP